jgi:cysteine desulfurase/selenocysteine lyase
MTSARAGLRGGAPAREPNPAVLAAEKPPAAFPVERIRKDFPILETLARGKPLIYLDNAATTQKPLVVLDRIERFYRTQNANIHRGVYQLSEEATRDYDLARSKVRRFINARHDREVVFVRGTTEAINLAAGSYGRSRLRQGDEVLISHIEHHSNIVPWQLLCEEKGASLKVIPMNARGELVIEEIDRLLTPRTRLVAVTHQSNALGTINPVKEIIRKAHAAGAKVLVDGAQAAAHLGVDVQDLDCDFYAFSGHKVLGPTGIGVFYGKAELVDEMPPYQGGGDMIRSVSFQKTTYAPPPSRFEAGTPNICGAIALGAALEYLQAIGAAAIRSYEKELLDYATAAIQEIPGVRIFGTAAEKASIVSFTLDAVHPHDIGTVLDQQGVAVRAGHHCAQPVMQFFGVPATARVSIAFYNHRQDIDAFIAALRQVKEIFH